mmetsp:Transcript_4627/g.13788  ORF Transcript_4627/g.13788 Transcript_4627/m.13788 type:complete len:296 (-) Transcript_4627:121-1008(-)
MARTTVDQVPSFPINNLSPQRLSKDAMSEHPPHLKVLLSVIQLHAGVVRLYRFEPLPLELGRKILESEKVGQGVVTPVIQLASQLLVLREPELSEVEHAIIPEEDAASRLEKMESIPNRFVHLWRGNRREEEDHENGVELPFLPRAPLLLHDNTGTQVAGHHGAPGGLEPLPLHGLPGVLHRRFTEVHGRHPGQRVSFQDRDHGAPVATAKLAHLEDIFLQQGRELLQDVSLLLEELCCAVHLVVELLPRFALVTELLDATILLIITTTFTFMIPFLLGRKNLLRLLPQLHPIKV